MKSIKLVYRTTVVIGEPVKFSCPPYEPVTPKPKPGEEGNNEKKP
jgi:hypothetical protein